MRLFQSSHDHPCHLALNHRSLPRVVAVMQLPISEKPWKQRGSSEYDFYVDAEDHRGRGTIGTQHCTIYRYLLYLKMVALLKNSSKSSPRKWLEEYFPFYQMVPFSGAFLNATEARALSEAISQADEEALETALLKVRLKMKGKVGLKLIRYDWSLRKKCKI